MNVPEIFRLIRHDLQRAVADRGSTSTDRTTMVASFDPAGASSTALTRRARAPEISIMPVIVRTSPAI